MTDEAIYIIELLKKHRMGHLTDSEVQDLESWLNKAEANRAFFNSLSTQALLQNELGKFSQYDLESLAKKLDARSEEFLRPAKIERIHFLKTTWFKYAAAIVLLFGAGIYFYITNQREQASVTQTNPVPVQNDVAPGGNRAVLTLADGSTIKIDSASNGMIAQQDNATITKNGEQIVYTAPVSRIPSPELSYNTMTTPRGGQYQLTLPDGSRVWLNAASSITYPTAFNGKERRVTITGEAYFEVAKDKTKKFIVTSPVSRLPSPGENSGLEIEVLGTHFNVNTYNEEPTKNITLLEGSVKLSLPSAVSRLPNGAANNGLKNVHTSLTLQPGQQGQLNRDQQLSLAAHPDLEQVMAWKNGVFNFNNTSFVEVMRILSRWYDVEVIYEGKVPVVRIGGEMGRDLNLGDVLQALKVIGIKYKIEGKRLIVSQ